MGRSFSRAWAGRSRGGSSVAAEALERRTLFAAGTLHFLNDANVPIPDDGVAGAGVVTSHINATGAPAGAVVSAVTIRYRITHPFISDLFVRAGTVDGAAAEQVLWNREGGSGDNIDETEQSLHRWDGLSPNRTWSLSADDAAGADAGFIDSFEIWIDWVTAGSIGGVVWDDADADGTRDAGEPPLPGWTVYLDDDADGTHDAGEAATVSDSSGAYAFAGLAAGTYQVAQIIPDGWSQTCPGPAGRVTLDAAGGAGAAAATVDLANLTTTGGAHADAHALTGRQLGGEVPIGSLLPPNTDASGPLTNIDDFRADPRFAGIDGSGFAAVIIDTGIDLNHPFFGPDADANGVADRVVFQYDFSGANDPDASDTHGHGSNVSSIVASSDPVFRGMAPAANIIHLKAFPDGASPLADVADIEEALAWVAANAAAYNIASVNMSLGAGNFNSANTSSAYHDEILACTNAGVIVVASAGNSFFSFNSAQGVGLPAADSNVIAVSATWDASHGGPINWGGGSTDFTTGPDRVTSFSQRSTALTGAMAPGAFITGAGPTGGLVTFGGTSQAAPHVAGIVALAQELAVQEIGRRLTLAEVRSLLNATGVTVNDGDDENDNVANTGANFRRVDVLALGNAILDMAVRPLPNRHTVSLSLGEEETGIDFGDRRANAPPAGAPDSYALAEDATLTVPAPGVLGNDADPEGGPLSAVLVSGPAHGALTLNADGSFAYTPAANYSGPDVFTYKPGDGFSSGNTVTVSLTVTPVNDTPSAALGPASPGVGGAVTPGWGQYWFRVTYADDGAVTRSTVGTGDVQVTGPGGYSQPGTLSSIAAAGSGWTATYRVPAPGGTWDAADNGTYTISMRAGQVADDAGLFVPATTLGTVVVSVPDTASPTATLAAADVTTAGTHHWFQVTYADDGAVNAATIGSGDVRVTGPGGYSQPGTLSNRVLSAGKYVVTYRVPAPGGRWGAEDNGTYTVSMQSGEVADGAGKFVPAGPLGSFAVRFADATPPAATLAASDVTSAGGAHHSFTVTYADNVAIAYGVIDGQDVRVTGPGGYSQLGVLSNLTSSGTTRVATYRVPAPGGGWDAADNGTYTVSLNASQVSDTSGNFAAAGVLGTFQVNVPPPPAAESGAAGPGVFSEVVIDPRRGQPSLLGEPGAGDLLR